jgi:uncharacterized protein (TIGR03382 family)
MRITALLRMLFAIRKLLRAITLLAVEIGTYGQGTINFDNIGVGPPIYDNYSTTVGAGVNPGAKAGLYVQGAGATFTLVPGSVTTFLGSADPQAQYLNAITVIVPSVAPGSAGTFEVRAWVGNSATWEDAFAAGAKQGRSFPISVTTGGAGSPPSLPADLVGLQSFAVTPFPEPSTIAFGVLGGLALLLRRRK